jgi:hypothetical protein
MEGLALLLAFAVLAVFFWWAKNNPPAKQLKKFPGVSKRLVGVRDLIWAVGSLIVAGVIVSLSPDAVGVPSVGGVILLPLWIVGVSLVWTGLWGLCRGAHLLVTRDLAGVAPERNRAIALEESTQASAAPSEGPLAWTGNITRLATILSPVTWQERVRVIGGAALVVIEVTIVTIRQA